MFHKNQRSGPRCVSVPGQERSSPGLLLLLPPGPSLPLSPSRLVCWGVSNQGRQAADGMTMLNWHGVVGTRKQTAAIFILLVFSPHRPSSSWIKPPRTSGTATWQLQGGWTEGTRGGGGGGGPGLEISLTLIRPPPPPSDGSTQTYTSWTTDEMLFT